MDSQAMRPVAECLVGDIEHDSLRSAGASEQPLDTRPQVCHTIADAQPIKHREPGRLEDKA